MKYKITLKRFVASFLLFLIITNTFYTSIVYASETDTDIDIKDKWVVVKDVTDEMKPGNKFIHKAKNLMIYLLGQCGAVLNGDISSIYDNQKWVEQVDKYAVTVQNTTTGEMGYKFDKLLTDDMLKIVKEATKEPENGGYELLKTVPLNKISMLYFDNGADYSTLYNLIKESNGIIGLYSYYGRGYFYQIPNNIFWIRNVWKYSGSSTDYKDREFDCVQALKNLNDRFITFSPRKSKTYGTIVKSWNDDTLDYGIPGRNAYNLKLLDSFDFFIANKNGINPLAVDEKSQYLVTYSGATIPVFNTVSDAVAYSVANNLYYTSSDYTGEGKEIIIPMDEIDKILNGYYNGMYDLLQQLIEQNGGNALTPEQLQKLVDEVKASFGMIQDTIDKGFAQQDILIQKNSQILQNIADALNKFFSQSKESRTAFLKEFKDYAKDQQTRDDALYKLISDYIESTKNNNPEPSEPVPPPEPGDSTGTTDNSAWHEKLYNTIKKGFDDVVNGLQKGFSSVVDELKKIKHWTALDTLLDGAGAVGEWVSLLTDLLDPEKRLGTLTDFVGTAMDALNDTTNLVKGKFPFCIPVDILALMQTLSAEPQTPVFKIPFVIESWDIHAEVEIDLKDFDIISDISRTFLTILWCCALMNFTTKITDMKSI